MLKNIDYESQHYCPVYDKVIDSDLCYESMMCLNRCFKISSVSEPDDIQDIEAARKICINCKYTGL